MTSAAPAGAGEFRAGIRAGRRLGCIWLSLGSVAVAELAADAGPDAVMFDLQHGLWERQALEAAIGIVRQRSVPLVRTADASPLAISTALDAGALGVVVPLVETAEQAAAVVSASRYPPAGTRSGGGVRPLMDFKAYAAAANDRILVAVMIETARGVENAAAIAATPGVDMVFIGTGDLALSIGTFPEFGPRHEAAVLAVQAACRAAGTPCGCFTPYATFAADRRGQGFQLGVLADDITLTQLGFRGAVARFRPGKATPVDGATILVTGANRGIGRCLVRALLDAGAARIHCAARDPAGLADLVAQAPGRLVPLPLDITRPDQVAAAAQAVPDLDILVNNAGVNHNLPLIGIADAGHARVEMETNYFGTLAMARAFAPVLARRGGGAIVNVLSILAAMNLPMMGSLCASKAAALSLTQALRAELAAQGTRVMAVLPGAVDTDMSRDFAGPKLAPEAVAAAIVDGLVSGVEDVYPGGMAAGVAMGLALDAKAVEREFATYLPAAAQGDQA